MHNGADSGPADARSIFRQRARALARRTEAAEHAEASLEVLEFTLAHERYAVEARHVAGVEPLTNLSPIPCTPSFVAGIVNMRGRLVPVLDLKKLFALPETGLTDLHAVVIVNIGDFELGLLADLIKDVRRVAVASLQRTLPTLTQIGAEYLKGVTPDCLVVLELERMLTDPRIIVNENVED